MIVKTEALLPTPWAQYDETLHNKPSTLPMLFRHSRQVYFNELLKANWCQVHEAINLVHWAKGPVVISVLRVPVTLNFMGPHQWIFFKIKLIYCWILSSYKYNFLIIKIHNLRGDLSDTSAKPATLGHTAVSISALAEISIRAPRNFIKVSPKKELGSKYPKKNFIWFWKQQLWPPFMQRPQEWNASWERKPVIWHTCVVYSLFRRCCSDACNFEIRTRA